MRVSAEANSACAEASGICAGSESLVAGARAVVAHLGSSVTVNCSVAARGLVV